MKVMRPSKVKNDSQISKQTVLKFAEKENAKGGAD